MLDKYKNENEFYGLVNIKCYSYVPSLMKGTIKNGKSCKNGGLSRSNAL
ncbi:hypothetical protein [Spiroplasma endosymbiont of Clivina fossor]